MEGEDRGVIPSHPFRWFPEFLAVNRRRWESQVRLLGPAVLIGIVAGLGAVLFSIACQLVVLGTLDGLAGNRATGPAGEARVPWIGETATPFYPWLLLVVPVLGGLVSGYLVF